MWARIIELLIALWLVISFFAFGYHSDCLIVAAAIALFSLLSYRESLNKMHLLNALCAFYLLYVSYTYPVVPLPFHYQSMILSAFFLLLLAIIPSRASEPPLAWQRWNSRE